MDAIDSTPEQSIRVNILGRPKYWVTNITRCARSLISAHFAFDDDQEIVGAPNEKLLETRLALDINDEIWRFFLLLCQQTNQPVSLFIDDKFHRIGLLGQGQGYEMAYGRPAVREIVDCLLSLYIPSSLITDWYRDDLTSTYSILDQTEFIEYTLSWLGAFNNLASEFCTRRELQRLSSDYSCVTSEATVHWRDTQANWTDALIELLEAIGVLRFSHKFPCGYVIQRAADSSRVLNSFFGRGLTGAPGLDELFFGGLWVPGQNSPESKRNKFPETVQILISGEAASGKSTVATGMGVHHAARGGVTIFFSVEVPTSAIVRKISEHFRRYKPFISVVSYVLSADRSKDGVADDSITFHHRPDPIPEKNGWFVICHMPRGPIEDWRSYVNTVAQKWSIKSDVINSQKMIVIDSISALEGYGLPNVDWRKLLHSMSEQLRVLGYNLLQIEERSSYLVSDFQDFLADVHIKMQFQDSRSNEYRYRLLEVVKSRAQASHRGCHVVSIAHDQGLSVYPSSSAVISSQRRQVARSSHYRKASINVGIPGFADCLASGYEDGNVAWWRSGSITALIGERGAMKYTFGEQWLSQFAVKQTRPGSALALHFGDEFPPMGFAIKRQHQRSFGWGERYEVSPDQFGGSSCGIDYVLLQSGYVAPGFVLQSIQSLIAERKKAQAPFRRAVISDLGNVNSSFPALLDDAAFLPALTEILTSEGITTLLVYSISQTAKSESVLNQVLSISENIIRLRPVQHAGHLLTAIWVERSASSLHNRGTYELRRIANYSQSFGKSTGTSSLLEVCDTFDLVSDPLGKHEVAKIKLVLHAETQLQAQYNLNIRLLRKGIDAFDVEVLDHALAFSRHLIARRAMAEERALWMVQVDAPMASGDDIEANIYNRSIKTMLHSRGFLHQLADLPAEARNESTIPYYLNPSFLVARRGFVQFASHELKASNIASGMGDYSWDELTDAAKRYRGQKKEKIDVLFDCGRLEVPQNLNCLFIEILESLLQKDKSHEKCIFSGQNCWDYFDPGVEENYLRLVNAFDILRNLLA
ncbi:TPA: hypothetical protein DIV49_02775, partial [Candidatus Saccharibacteria bacterium]|nr:hypothetical protein [Candidatus Saccharibacteria bacterium]